MQLEDLTLVSVDDHVVEPPDLFAGRLPQKYADVAPKLVRKEVRHRRMAVHGRRAAQHRVERGRGPPARGVRDGPAVVRRHADRLLRHPRPRQGHERQRTARFDVLPELPAVLRPALRPRRAEGRAARGRVGAGVQRLAHRELVRRVSRSVHPARAPDDVGRRQDGRRGAARRREGLPRGHLLGEPGPPRLPEHSLRPLGQVLCDVRRGRHGGERAHRFVVEDGDHRGRRPDERAHHALADQHRAGRRRLRVVERGDEVPEAQVRVERGRDRLDPLLPRAHRLHVRPPSLLDGPGHGRPPAEPGVRRAGHLLLDRRPGRGSRCGTR